MAVKLVAAANYTTLTTPQIGFAAMTLLMCALALLMCASHSRRRRQWSECYGFFDEEDPVTVIEHHHNVAIFGSTTSADEDLEEEVEEKVFQGNGEAVWQKNILMGGKCQLPDFSGVIIYDTDGKMVAPPNNIPRLTWK